MLCPFVSLKQNKNHRRHAINAHSSTDVKEIIEEIEMDEVQTREKFRRWIPIARENQIKYLKNVRSQRKT